MKKILFFLLISLFIITPVYAENNKVTLTFDTNGGVLASEHSKRISLEGSTIYKDNSIYHMYIVYGNTLTNTGLPNYNDPKAINIIRNGYHIKSDEEWNTKSDGTGVTYSQKKVYKGTDFCSARYNDCNVKLYLKWIKDSDIEVKNINLSSSNVSLFEGETITLSTNVQPENATNKQLNWSSSNNDIVSVEQNGKIHAKQKGEAIITVTANNGIKTTCKIEVKAKINSVKIKYNINGASFIIKNRHFNIVNGLLYKDNNIHYSVIPYGTKLSSTGLVNYNNSKLFEISKKGYYVEIEKEWINKETGKVYNQDAVYKGTDFCSAKTNDCIVELSINWKKKSNIAAIKLSKENLTIIEGTSKKIKYSYTSGSQKTNNVKWTSSNDKIASVDKNGKITGHKKGTVIITIESANGTMDTCKVEVAEKKIDNNLSVGYSKVSIHPDLDDYEDGLYLRGYGSLAKADNQYYKSYGIYATAIAIKDNTGKTILFISCDLGSMEVGFAKKLRQAISDNIKVPYSRIYISTTHTHSAPNTNSKNSKEYNEYLTRQLIKVSKESLSDLSYISNIYRGNININNMTFVRHYKTNGLKDRFGKGIVNGANYGLYYTKNDKTYEVRKQDKVDHMSKADNQMGLIRFQRYNNKDVLLVNWQAHPSISGGSSLTTISADFVGPFRNKVSKEEDCLVAYFTGAAGNLNWNTEIISEGKPDVTYYSKDSSKRTEEDVYRVTTNYGEALADYVINNYKSLKLDNLSLTKKISTKSVEMSFDKITNTDNKENVDIGIAKKLKEFKELGIVTESERKEFLTKLYSDKEMMKVIKNDEGLADYFDGDLNKKFTKDELRKFSSKKTTLIKKAGYELPGLNTSVIHSPYHASQIVRRQDNNNKTIKITVNSIKVGNLYFATVPYEMFDTNGSNIKNANKDSTTFIMELTNGKVGYIPSKEAFDYGCYEATIAPVKKDAAKTLQDKIIRSFKELRNE